MPWHASATPLALSSLTRPSDSEPDYVSRQRRKTTYTEGEREASAHQDGLGCHCSHSAHFASVRSHVRACGYVKIDAGCVCQALYPLSATRSPWGTLGK